VYVQAFNVLGERLLTLVVFRYISVCLKIMCMIPLNYGYECFINLFIATYTFYRYDESAGLKHSAE
jgi:hypothetical protein